MTHKENSDIKNKILHYYLNQKDIDKNKIKYIKVNEIECRKNYNTINNTDKSLSLNKKEKEKLTKQKTIKRIENNNNYSSNIVNNVKKKFIRERKEKRNTLICSNSIKKNLFEFKFSHFK